MEKSFSFLAILNLIFFISVIIVNGLANALPLNGIGTGELSDLYPNLFVPAGITFSIWGIIYLLLAGFCVTGLAAAFGNKLNPEFLSRIGVWFIISCIANLSWIFAWHWKKVGLSLLFMLLILLTLIMIYKKLMPDYETANKPAFIFVKLPFSVYLGWITVATIANVTALLVHANWNGFGLSEPLWTVIILLTAVLITCIIILRHKDLGYSLVVIWAFLGIILKRSSIGDALSVVIAASAGIVIIGAFFIIKLFR